MSTVTITATLNENPIPYHYYTSASICKNKDATSDTSFQLETARVAEGRYSLGTPDSQAIKFTITSSDYTESNILETEWVIYLASDPHAVGAGERRYLALSTTANTVPNQAIPQLINGRARWIELLLKQRTHYKMKCRFRTAGGWSNYTDLFYFKTRDVSYNLPGRLRKTNIQVVNGREIVTNLTPDAGRNKDQKRVAETYLEGHAKVNAEPAVTKNFWVTFL